MVVKEAPDKKERGIWRTAVSYNTRLTISRENNKLKPRNLQASRAVT